MQNTICLKLGWPKKGLNFEFVTDFLVFVPKKKCSLKKKKKIEHQESESDKIFQLRLFVLLRARLRFRLKTSDSTTLDGRPRNCDQRKNEEIVNWN